MMNARHPFLSCLLISSFAFYSCTSTKKDGANGSADPVSAETKSSENGTYDELPDELKDAHTFDPAKTLDQKTVEESDFYQIKKSVEENKANLDAAWREQDRLETSVKASKVEEERQKALKAQREEEEREKQRQKEIEAFEKGKEKRAKEAKEAEEEINKLPTISKDEIMWQGIED